MKKTTKQNKNEPNFIAIINTFPIFLASPMPNSGENLFTNSPATLRKLCLHFLSHWMGYDRDDSFPFNFEPNGISFGSKSNGKLSPRSYPIQCEKNLKYSFLSVTGNYRHRPAKRGKPLGILGDQFLPPLTSSVIRYRDVRRVLGRTLNCA